MSSTDQKSEKFTQQRNDNSSFLSNSARNEPYVEQTAFPERPASTDAYSRDFFAPGEAPYFQTGSMPTPQAGGALFDTGVNPRATRQLSLDVQGRTGQFPVTKSNTTALRVPVVITGSGKPSTGIRPPKGRRMVVHIAVTALLIFIVAGTLLAVSATQAPAQIGPNGIAKSLSSLFDNKGDNSASLPAQAATATAVTQDGFDPGNKTYAGVTNTGPTLGDAASNHFFQGQCTYWAAYRFHQLHGVWVPWYGNAWEWAGQASAYGWKVSSMPTVGAIIVLQPGVQGAGGYGHVAIVESINANGTVHTSNYNWYAAGGGFGILSYWDFSYPGSGVSFVTL
jgi:surface antigen